jgi:putative hydrolase of the HAD superfamily
MPLKPDRLRALTLDLDDTLWPVMPVIERAEAVLHDWFVEHAPRVAQRFDASQRREVRNAVAREHPHWAHDLSAQRLEAIRRLLAGADEDEALAAVAFEVFYAERQRVQLYDDVLEALRRLSGRWPLVALSNGNADVVRVGLGDWFIDSVSARQVGVAKPDRRIFEAACRRLGCAPHEVLHIGDDALLDVAGARAAGLQTAWIRRIDSNGAAPSAAADGALADWHGPDLLSLTRALGVAVPGG